MGCICVCTWVSSTCLSTPYIHTCTRTHTPLSHLGQQRVREHPVEVQVVLVQVVAVFVDREGVDGVPVCVGGVGG